MWTLRLICNLHHLIPSLKFLPEGNNARFKKKLYERNIRLSLMPAGSFFQNNRIVLEVFCILSGDDFSRMFTSIKQKLKVIHRELNDL